MDRSLPPKLTKQIGSREIYLTFKAFHLPLKFCWGLIVFGFFWLFFVGTVSLVGFMTFYALYGFTLIGIVLIAVLLIIPMIFLFVGVSIFLKGILGIVVKNCYFVITSEGLFAHERGFTAFIKWEDFSGEIKRNTIYGKSNLYIYLKEKRKITYIKSNGKTIKKHLDYLYIGKVENGAVIEEKLNNYILGNI